MKASLPDSVLSSEEDLPHKSLLDVKSLQKPTNGLRGILYLAWCILLLSVLSSMSHTYRTKGYVIGPSVWILLSSGVGRFVVADALMNLSLFVVPLVFVLVRRGLLPVAACVFVRHIVQGSIIAAAVIYAHHQAWSFLQSAVLILHTICMLMKIHSYSCVNEQLFRMAQHQPGCRESELYGKLAAEAFYGDTNPHWNTFPDNITLANFVHYLLVPGLVYHPTFPTTSRMSRRRIVEKLVSGTLAFLMICILVEESIIPVLTAMDRISVASFLIELFLPFLLLYILSFYLVFECLCNFMAEITRTADRRFYDDWWNSRSMDEFSRKWNRPVHSFLYLHVYREATAYGCSKDVANVLTFFFSSLLHEFALAVMIGKVQMYFFVLQMTQIPLIYGFKALGLAERYPLGSVLFFWLALGFGLPITSFLYTRDHFLKRGIAL